MSLLLCVLLLLVPARVQLDADPAPVALRLAGRVRQEGHSDWRFEIIMAGHDRYYRKEWSGDQDAESGFWSIDLVVGDFWGRSSQSWSERGSRGGGSSGGGGKGSPQVARRLWVGPKLVGGTKDQVRWADERHAEDFGLPTAVVKVRIPTVIRWTDRTRSVERVYFVEDIGFYYRFNPEFFDSVKRQRFPERK
jgi:hypothetical protein